MPTLVTGATGFIGKRLVAELPRPTVLSRDPGRARSALGDVRAYAWEPESGPPPAEAFRGDDGQAVEQIFHLAGEPVAEGRWNDEKKRRIRDSRIAGTRNLVDAIAAQPERPRVLVCASAVGYYGSRGDTILDENAGPAEDFLAAVCQGWEAEARRAEALGVRVCMLRIGIVLGEGGGALGSMETPFRLGLGGRIGDGKQWMPWVHARDIVGLLLHCAADESIRGPVNGTSPTPVRNVDFTRALGAALHRPAILPIPRFAVRAAFGEMSDVLLASMRVVPRVAEATGYSFHYTDLGAALRSVYAPSVPR